MTGTRTGARQATRRVVLEAAGQLFSHRGFPATTVREIAREAGVSVGTVMAAGDKEALLVELFDTIIAERQQRADQATLAEGTRCADAALALVEPFVVLFEERRDLARSYASVLVSGRHSSVIFTDLARDLIAGFERIVTNCGCANSAHASGRAAALHAAYIGGLFMWSAAAQKSAADVMDQLAVIFAAICPHERNPS